MAKTRDSIALENRTLIYMIARCIPRVGASLAVRTGSESWTMRCEKDF
jgi:hypothetical protein